MPYDSRMLSNQCLTLYYLGSIEEHSKSLDVSFKIKTVKPDLSEVKATTKTGYELWITATNAACSCPAFQYRSANHSTCKHIIALSRAFLEHKGAFKCTKTK
jgi:predicted nucleic acid-binding Zn finger protein